MITISHTDWTRQEAIKLSGLTISAFEYFERMEIVKPKKVGSLKKPSVFYTWHQLLAIKAYARLRKDCTPKIIQKALEYLNPDNPWEVLIDKRLMAFNNKIYWIQDTPENVYKVITCSKENQGQLLLNFCVKELIDEIVKNGRENNILDFEERFNEAIKAA